MQYRDPTEETPNREWYEANKLDVSNIIRGGPRKAKFNCELGRHGEHALESLEKDDLDFAVELTAYPRSFLSV